MTFHLISGTFKLKGIMRLKLGADGQMNKP